MPESENRYPDLIPISAEEETPYQKAIYRAWEEMAQIQAEERELLIRKARLNQTIEALWPLAFPDKEFPDINAMTLADAIRMVVQSCPGRPTTVKEIRAKLQDVGFDLSKYKNALASIHTACTRMVDSGEMVWTDDQGNRLKAGEKMKPVLTAEPDTTVLLGMMGENSAGDE